MRLLLHVKGVVSITFDLNQKRCIMRTKQDVKPEVRVEMKYKLTSKYHHLEIIILYLKKEVIEKYF